MLQGHSPFGPMPNFVYRWWRRRLCPVLKREDGPRVDIGSGGTRGASLRENQDGQNRNPRHREGLLSGQSGHHGFDGQAIAEQEADTIPALDRK